MSGLQVDGVDIERGGVRVVAGATATVDPGRALALLGPSGAGKTSLLHAVAGLVPVACGRVAVDGRDVTDLAPERRGVGLMFQDFALFPHLDVAGNVAFGLRMAGAGRDEQADVVAERLAAVGLEGLQARDVSTLSGGQRQRVALARALATRPGVLLLDEPLGALDRQLREELLVELAALVRDAGPATVVVTHDRDEAFTLGDDVAVMREGRIVQLGSPAAVWAEPVDVWTARFLGHPNVLDAGEAAAVGLRSGPSSHVLVPPDAVTADPDEAGAAVVTGVVWRSGRIALTVEVDGTVLTAEPPPTTPVIAVGERVDVRIDGGRVRPVGD